MAPIQLFARILLSAVLTFSLSGNFLFAQVMQSPSYQMQSDSVNFGGGFSSSTNFQQESTLGEISTGPSESASYALRAGYQQMQEVYIALSGAANVNLAPAIPGVSGGSATGSTTVTVTTDSAAGYALTIAASDSPTMQSGGNTIADYTPVGAPDFSFITGASDAHFGYSPEGVDIVQRFKDNGAVCNAGTADADNACWDGLSTSAVTIAQSGASNHPVGATTTIEFQVGIGTLVAQTPGAYVATTTITALPL